MRPPNHLLHSITRFLSAPIPTKRSSSTSTASPSVDSTTQRPLWKSCPPQSVERLVLAGRLKDAFRSLVLLHWQGMPAEPDVVCSVIRRCTGLRAVMEGRQLHAHITVVGFPHDTFVLNHLIDMYGKSGSLGEAHSVFKTINNKNLHSWNILMSCYCKYGSLSAARNLFDAMPQRDSVSWNLMISGYDRHGPCQEGLNIFKRSRCSGAKADHFGVSSVISACSNLRFITSGRMLHGYSINIGLNFHVYVCSALIELYSKCMEISDARRIFDLMDVREDFTWNSMLSGYVHCTWMDQALRFFGDMPIKTVVSWTTVIEGCAQHGLNTEAITLFHKMRESGLHADQVAFVSVLNACTGLLNSKEGAKVHGLIVKCGYELDSVICSVIVALYAKCGDFDAARSIISIMPVVDDFSWSVLIAEYAKHGQMEHSRRLFDSLEVKSVPLWNALITGYSELGMYEEALQAFQEMHASYVGDEFTYGSLLSCTNNFGLKFGQQLHSSIMKAGLHTSVYLCCALVDMYFCFNDCEAAENAFNTVEKQNIVMWNAMILGYGRNNLHHKACGALQLMRVSGTKVDGITLSCVLDSCSSTAALSCGTQVHGLACKVGLVSDVIVGSAIVDMYAKCRIIEYASLAFFSISYPTVISWTALLGGLVKCGLWDKANHLFDVMPDRNVVSWNVMLSGYVQHGCGYQAITLYSQMIESGILPDQVTFINLLTLCYQHLLKEQGKQIHAQVIKTGIDVDSRVSNILSEMHQKFGTFLDGEHAESLSTEKPARSMDETES